MKIGDIFFGVKGEFAEFQTQIQKEGDQAGTTLGERVASGFKKNAGKAIGAGLAAGFALATQRGVELDSAMSKLQADTGMTADEAKRAGSAINDMSGRNLQGISTIGDTLSKVVTDLGLTGDAATATAEQFLKFATATGQDSTEAVKSFDDILDAYGKTAADIPGIMDQLVASHQRYGGSITENEQVLGKMAPQLQALNLSMDDGIGILNLFAASGLDASTAQKALNAAVKNLPPGTNFKDILAEISSIEDPTLRAQRAIEVFGAKAGVGLANALKPGQGSLDSFVVKAGDVPGAADAAAGAIEGSIGNRVQLALKGFGAAVTDVLGKGGPMLTGLASLVSLAAPVVPMLLSVAAAGWATIAPFLAAAAPFIAVGAAVALLVVGLGGLDAVLKGVRDAIGAFRDVLGQVVAGILEPFRALFDVLSHVPGEVGKSFGQLRDQVDSLQASLDGTTARTEAAAAAVRNLAAAQTTNAQATRDHALSERRDAADAAANAARMSALLMDQGRQRASFAASEHADAARAIADAKLVASQQEVSAKQAANAKAVAYEAMNRSIVAGVKAAAAEVAVRAANLPKTIGDAILSRASDLSSALSNLKKVLKDGLTPQKAVAEALGYETVLAIRAGFKRGDPIAVGAARDTAFKALEALSAAGKTEGKTGAKRVGQYMAELVANGLDRGQIAAVLAAAGLSQAAIDQLMSHAPGAKKPGATTGDKFNEGIGSKEPGSLRAGEGLADSAHTGSTRDPGFKGAGIDHATTWIGGVTGKSASAKTAGAKLPEHAYEGSTKDPGFRGSGTDHATTWIGGITSKSGSATTAGALINSAAKSAMNDLSGAARGGLNLASAYIGGVSAGLRQTRGLRTELAGIRGLMYGDSPPPDPTSPLHTIDRGGYNVADAWVIPFVKRLHEGIAEARAALAFPAIGAPAFAMADISGAMAPMRQALDVAGTATVHHDFGPITVRVDGGDLSPAAAQQLGRGIGDSLDLRYALQTAHLRQVPG